MTRRSLALAAVVAALAACASEKVAPSVTSRTSTARTLGIVALEHPEEPRSQALLALELDARRLVDFAEPRSAPASVEFEGE